MKNYYTDYPILTDSPEKLNFSGHQGFTFRYGWLNKAVSNIEKNPHFFSNKVDALIEMGVGKNMVDSISYWATAMGIITSNMKSAYEVSDLGKYLFGNSGKDKFLEYPGTLWLLHWMLCSRIEKASIYYLVFTRWNIELFSKENLLDWLEKRVLEVPGTRATRSSLKRDVDVFIRTYLPIKGKNKSNYEEIYNCPLNELGLIHQVDRDVFRFTKTKQSTLPNEVLTFAIFDYISSQFLDRKSISFESLFINQGSPGAVFKLSENELIERLEQISSFGYFTFDDTAGVRTIHILNDEKVSNFSYLDHYYDYL